VTAASFEVEQPILNSPYAEPAEHWWIEEGRVPKRLGFVAGQPKPVVHRRP